MLEYEQLEPYIYKWAHHFRKKYNHRFEADELVNEVWAHGKVQKMNDIQLASNRAKFDMIDYVRRETNGRVQVNKQYKSGPKVFTNVEYMGSSEEDNFWDAMNFKNKKNNCYDEELKRIDDIDEINDIMQFPSEKQKRYMNMYFLEGKNQSEIASELSVVESTVYKHIRSGVLSCQKRECIKSFSKKNKTKIVLRKKKRKYVCEKN